MRKRCLSEKVGWLTLVGLMVGSLAWSMDVRGAYLPLGREQAVDKVQDFEVQDSCQFVCFCLPVSRLHL